MIVQVWLFVCLGTIAGLLTAILSVLCRIERVLCRIERMLQGAETPVRHETEETR